MHGRRLWLPQDRRYHDVGRERAEQRRGSRAQRIHVASKVCLSIGPILTDPPALSHLFMNLGPWMTLEDYLLHLGGVLVAAALMAAVWLQERRRSAHGAPASAAPRGIPAS